MNKYGHSSQNLNTIIQRIKNNELILNPDFQRKEVWKEQKMKDDLIWSILSEMPIGFITLSRKTNDKGILEYEVVDGKQRLTTINEFINGDLSINGDVLKKFFKEQKDFIENLGNNEEKAKFEIFNKKILSFENFKFNFKSLPRYIQQIIEGTLIGVTSIFLNQDDKKRDETVREYFRILQNQEKLRAGEILNATNEKLLNYLFKNNNFDSDNLIDKFCKITNFNNNRMDCEKNLNVFIGISLKKMRMGMPDKEIVKVCNKIEIDDLEKSESLLSDINKIIDDVIHSNEKEIDDSRLSILGIKILLMSYIFSKKTIFYNRDLKTKAKLVKSIIKKISFWNSMSSEKKTKFLEVLKSNLKEEVFIKIEKGLENCWLLSRTTHSYEDILKKFETINFVLDFFIENEKYLN